MTRSDARTVLRVAALTFLVVIAAAALVDSCEGDESAERRCGP